jgi:hypothetical protein
LKILLTKPNIRDAEVDLLIVRGHKKMGFEVKRTSLPCVTPAIKHAVADLKLNHLDVIHTGDQTFPMGKKSGRLPCKTY